ncbi:phage tail family protein [Romboutsia ilealis]|uniref:phage tail family protein n=1 Tax=Romboutsia ilealis TaxID=1115758 RepID=UPI002573BCD1|nr:phage tail family protein [Romboutsia ilealis]
MGFVYRNKNNEEINLTQRNIKIINIEGISSLTNEINTTTGVNQSGETYVSNRVEPRDIDILLRLKTTEDEFRTLKSKLIKVFNPALEELILKSINGDKKISVRVKVSPDFKNTSYKTNKEVDISLVALDPYWKDINETKTEIAVWKGSFSFPLFINVENGTMMGYREPSLIVNTNNIGDVKTGMRIEFKALGTVVNPKLVNVETQDFIKINKTLEKDEIIEVTTDFSNKRVIFSKNGITENAFNYWDLYSTFLQLEIGDNLFRYDAEDGLDNLEVSIYHTSRYLGV